MESGNKTELCEIKTVKNNRKAFKGLSTGLAYFFNSLFINVKNFINVMFSFFSCGKFFLIDSFSLTFENSFIRALNTLLFLICPQFQIN